jgi:integrase
MPDGTRKQFYERTAAEATRKRDRARAQVDRGLPLPDERLTTGDWLQRWFDNTHVKEVKPSTIRYQRSILNRHLLPFFGNIPLVRLTGDDVDRYIERKLAEGITPSVVGTHRGMLRKAIQAAGREDRVARNVVDFTITPKRKRHAQRPTFTKDQVLAFLQLIRGHPLEGVFLFGMTLGLRIGEATGVMWQDVDLEHRLFFLRHQVAPDIQADGGECLCGTRCGRAALVEDLKSESSTRGLKLPAVIIPALRRQLVRNAHARELRLVKGKEWMEHGLVFPSAWGNPMQPTRVRAWLGPLCKAAGLAPCRFHDLRHAWGSLMKSAGVSDEDLAQAMGHASAQVTKRTYLHALPDSAVRVTSVVDELMPPNPVDTSEARMLSRELLSLRARRPTSP